MSLSDSPRLIMHTHTRSSPAPLASMTSRVSSVLALLLAVLCAVPTAQAYQVAITEADELRQTCSGMWSGKETNIQLTFNKNASGTVATIFYEWQDFDHLGKAGPDKDFFGDALKTYICTPAAVRQGVCDNADVGNFIVDNPATAHTIQKQRLDFGSGLAEDKTITYAVNATGYYCVAAVPLTTDSKHAAFEARITFNNVYKGQLPGGEYPKLGFYFGLTCLYILLAAGWGYLCVKHKDELLTVQHFISGLFVILVVEQLVTWLYYSYLNAHAIDFWRLASVSGDSSETFSARALLVVESLIDSTRNSASFFLLLIVAMGYGVVRPSLEPKTMLRVRILTAVHLICGCLYSVGIVLLSIEAGGSWVFLFIFPLAFTLTGFMMWTLNSLNATIQHLTARKQTFKLYFFTRLYRILIGAVVVIFAFFVVSSIAFSQSGGQNFPSQTWRWRWFLLDGWTSTLYLTVFASIAWIWRPTGQNLRLSMSDEVATGDDGGEDIELAGEYAGGPAHPDDSDDEDDEDGTKAEARKRALAASAAAGAVPGAGGSRGPPPAYDAASRSGGHAEEHEGEVMFSLGDGEDEDDEGHGHAQGATPRSAAGRERVHAEGRASEETLLAGGEGGRKED